MKIRFNRMDRFDQESTDRSNDQDRRSLPWISMDSWSRQWVDFWKYLFDTFHLLNFCPSPAFPVSTKLVTLTANRHVTQLVMLAVKPIPLPMLLLLLKMMIPEYHFDQLEPLA